MRLAVRTQDSLPLEARLLDRVDRGHIVGCRLGEHPLQPELTQAPDGAEPKRPRCDAAATRAGKNRDGEPRDLFIVTELEVEQTERPVISGVRDDEGRAAPRTPLLLYPGTLSRWRSDVSGSSFRRRRVSGSCDASAIALTSASCRTRNTISPSLRGGSGGSRTRRGTPLTLCDNTRLTRPAGSGGHSASLALATELPPADRTWAWLLVSFLPWQLVVCSCSPFSSACPSSLLGASGASGCRWPSGSPSYWRSPQFLSGGLQQSRTSQTSRVRAPRSSRSP